MQLALCKLKSSTGIWPKIYLVTFVFKHTNTESVQLSISAVPTADVDCVGWGVLKPGFLSERHIPVQPEVIGFIQKFLS